MNSLYVKSESKIARNNLIALVTLFDVSRFQIVCTFDVTCKLHTEKKLPVTVSTLYVWLCIGMHLEHVIVKQMWCRESLFSV